MDPVASKIACYMKELCGHEDRHPGRPGNRAATALFKRVAESCGLEVETSELECIDVERGELTLEVGGDRFEFRPGPYSNGCDVTAALTEASTIEQLEAGGYEGSVLFLHGELCRELNDVAMPASNVEQVELPSANTLGVTGKPLFGYRLCDLAEDVCRG